MNISMIAQSSEEKAQEKLLTCLLRFRYLNESTEFEPEDLLNKVLALLLTQVTWAIT